MSRSTPRLDVPAATASLEPVRRFVEAQARAAGLDEARVMQVVLAVDEAAANIVKHAFHGETGHSFTVTVRTTTEQLVIRLLHDGDAFDPSRYRMPPPLEQAAHERRKGGLGVHLMHRLMDDVAFRTTGSRSEVRLSKKR